MLKYPSPIEKELDRVRERMWRQAGRNPERWFAMIREKSKQAVEEIKKVKDRKIKKESISGKA